MDFDLSGPPSAAAEDGTWLACIECGATVAPFDGPTYRCPDCGGLLEVRYDDYPDWRDFGSAGERTDADAGERTDADAGEGSTPGGHPRHDGVWRYADALPVEREVTIEEGDTPLYDVPRLQAATGVRTLRVKHEGMNPTGSFKDRGMTVGVGVARRIGVDRLAVASTGNTSAALATYGARTGMETLVLLPAGKVAAGKVAQASLHGARILEVDGNFDDCLDVVSDLADKGEAYLLNSLNPFRLEGQKTIGLEILEQARDDYGRLPDRIVLPVGNAGNTAAIHKAFRELVAAGALAPGEVPTLTGVQAAGAAPFVEAIEEGRESVRRWDDVETRATAIRIGDPVNAPKALHAVRETGGTAVAVPDEAITRAQRDLAGEGLGVEPASAASLAGLRELRERGVVDESEDVVLLTTGHLLKDPDAAAAAGTEPEPVGATTEAVLDHLRGA
ncbi:MAG: threonine synthase [Halobacteriales archaeon]